MGYPVVRQDARMEKPYTKTHISLRVPTAMIQAIDQFTAAMDRHRS